MKCPKVKKHLIDYLEGTLSSKKMAAIHLHLHDCETCAKEEQDLSGVLGKVRTLNPQDPGETFWKEFPAQVSAKLHATQAGETPTFRDRFSWWFYPMQYSRRWLQAGFSVFFVALASILVFYFSSSSQPPLITQREDWKPLFLAEEEAEEILSLSSEEILELSSLMVSSIPSPESLASLAEEELTFGTEDFIQDLIEDLSDEDIDALLEYLNEEEWKS